MPYHERADLRFVWNGHLLRELANQPELCKFCLPLLHGCILNALREHDMFKKIRHTYYSPHYSMCSEESQIAILKML